MLFEILCIVIFIAVTVLGIIQNRIYKISLWKLVLTIVVGAIVSYWGIHILAYIENGYWGKWSFFGCILFVPPIYWLLARILKIPFDVLMDFSGPMCALFFVLIKINCAVKGCCYGIHMYTTEMGNEINFPSALVESVCCGIIFVALVYIQQDEMHRGRIGPIFLMSYGIMRFVLSFFRYNPTYFRFLKNMGVFIPTGQVWAVICVIWGFIWMCRIQSQNEGRKISIKECISSFRDMF